MDAQTLARALKVAVDGDANELVRLAHESPVELASLLRRHQVAGYTWALLQDEERLEGLPMELARPLEHAYASQVERNPTVLACTRKVVQLLATASIPSIVLKGVYFAERLQGGLDRRFMWDCDVLVPPKQLHRALERLVAEGFKVTSGVLLSREATWRHVHSVDLERAGLGLDLHARFRNRPGYAVDYEDVWRQRATFTVAGSPLPVLADTHEVTFLALSLIHDLEAGRGKLKHLLDLYLLLRRVDGTLDWGRFVDDRRQERLERVVLTALGLVLQLFDAGAALPKAASALSAELPLEARPREGLAADLLSRRRQDPRSRLWFAGLCPDGRLRYLAWWAATVPFRYAAGRRI